MNRLFIVCSAIAALALTACGGGSSVGNPGGGATPPPAVQYTTKIAWSGIMAPTGVPTQSDLARTESAGRGTQSAVLVSSNVLIAAADTNALSSIGSQDNVATVYAQVSPAPSVYPATSFTTTSAATIVPTPSPAPSSSPFPPDVMMTATNITETGKTVTASVAAPVSQTASQHVIIYPRLTVYCDPSYNPQPGEFVGGVTWSGTAWTQASSIATADLYVMGSSCPGIWHDPSVPQYTESINFPGGGVVVANSVSFDSLSVSGWTNTVTKDSNSDMSGKVLLCKTRGGTVVKAYLMIFGNGAVSFVDEVHGQGLDGF